MMSKRLSLWILLVLLSAAQARALTTAPATAPAAAPAEKRQYLLSHGSDERQWLIQERVDRSASSSRKARSVLFVRKQGETWEFRTELPALAASINSYGTQAAVLLQSGEWILYSNESETSGPPLPNGLRIRAMATDGSFLYALGEPPPTPPTTQPATQPTQRTPSRIFRLGATGWSSIAQAPDGIPADAPVSMAVIGEKFYIAFDKHPLLTLLQLDGNTWKPVAQLQHMFQITRLKLINNAPQTILWTAGTGRASLHWVKSGGKLDTLDLHVASQTAPEDMAVAYAMGKVRIYRTEKHKLFERVFDPTSPSADDSPETPVQLPVSAMVPNSTMLMQAAMIALVCAIAASIYRRGQIGQAAEALAEGRLQLAPLSKRLLAGLIDALPLLIAMAMAAFRMSRIDPGDSEETIVRETRIFLALLGGAVGLYIAHVVIGELVAGRSIGKAVCGLRVVSLTGDPAGPLAILLRNLLRLLDAPVITLALILLSPLRQRAGDIAAGTLVIVAGSSEKPTSHNDTDAKESA